MEYQKIQRKFHAHLPAATHLLYLVREVAYLWRLSWLWDWCSSRVLLYFRLFSTQTNCLHRRSPTLIRGTNILLFSEQIFLLLGHFHFPLTRPRRNNCTIFCEGIWFNSSGCYQKEEGGMEHGKREMGNGNGSLGTSSQQNTAAKNALRISKKYNICSWSLL